MPPVLPGIDNREALTGVLSSRRLALITNHTGVTRDLLPSAVAIRGVPGARLVRLLAPEHGVWGEAPAGELLGDTCDPLTGLPVSSLYSSGYEPAREALSGIDALVFDIQDIGSRYYTYLWTMAKCMAAAARERIPFVVLDRPNPIGGVKVEGNLSRTEFSSLVGLYPICARHGMTAGEIASYVNEEFSTGADLTVVPVTGWRRDMWQPDTGLTFVPPSPNSTSIDMAALYPGTCLIEGTNMSEGRGTTKPFEVFGAPWLDPFALSAALEEKGLPGVRFRPTYFRPVSSKHECATCGGVFIHVTDRKALDPFALGIEIICLCRQMFSQFGWYEYEGLPADRLFGTDEVRLMITRGAPAKEVLDWCEPGRLDFLARRRKYLIYPEVS
jgi:uncharacterized protein YbbC (DUF1343 family)